MAIEIQKATEEGQTERATSLSVALDGLIADHIGLSTEQKNWLDSWTGNDIEETIQHPSARKHSA